MITIITGDVVDSQLKETKVWLKALKKALSKYGKEPTSWEIYRGDSFQLELDVHNALEKVIALKAMLKQDGIDVRMAIGLGEKEYEAKKITASNGSAFVNSGDCFESLKKSTLAIKTPWVELDESLNIMLDLALLSMDNWSTTSAELIKIALQNPGKKQTELTKLVNKTQSTISEGLKRAGYDEIQKMIQYYKRKITEKC